MATIRVYRDEADGDEFPRVCVRCGADADADATEKFRWTPGWVIVLIVGGLLPWLIVTVILQKSMAVTMPVCRRHRGHWRNRRLYAGLGFLGWLAVVVAAVAFEDELFKNSADVVLGVLLVGGLVWLVSAALYARSAIRPGKITDRWAELVNVDESFAAAWDDSTRPGPARPPTRRAARPIDDDNW